MLRFEPTTLKDAFVLDLAPVEDERGFFARAWCRRDFEARGLVSEFVQVNQVYSARNGSIRGLHYQAAPFEEAKIVRCIRGGIWDVVVDLRPGSETFLKWFGVELTPENRRQLYVPKDFAHGYQTLRDDTEVLYQVSTYYTPAAERGIRWDDPRLAIEWPERTAVTLSAKDRSWPDYVPADAVAAAALSGAPYGSPR